MNDAFARHGLQDYLSPSRDYHLLSLRDLVEATIWRQASAITVPTVGQSSAPPLPPQTPTATPPRTVGQRVPRPPIPLIGG